MILPWIDEGAPPEAFPPPEQALPDPPGLLAAGGDLRPERLLAAYRRGIFPWYGEDQPILWWSPEPRAVFPAGGVHVSRSLRRTLRRGHLHVTADTDFEGVVAGCAAPRGEDEGTWITPAMALAYRRLHELGHAHSVEVRDENGALVGGIYGVAVGAAFAGESMFSRVTDASKVALATLARQLWRWDFHFLDAQVASPHLLRMGVEEWSRPAFLQALGAAVAEPDRTGGWRLDPLEALFPEVPEARHA
jgi:leucyl/phenylalanyl-tRNA--protein transferase